jgi:hypothetical protein
MRSMIEEIPSYGVLLSALRSAFVAGGGHSRNLGSVYEALRCTDEIARTATNSARSVLLRIAANHLRCANAETESDEEMRALALARRAMTVALFECDTRGAPRTLSGHTERPVTSAPRT